MESTHFKAIAKILICIQERVWLLWRHLFGGKPVDYDKNVFESPWKEKGNEGKYTF
jgi:hypothetical protein